MIEVVSLVLPFFGLILIGAVAARAVTLPDSALGWMNLFVIHIALPALFFRFLSRTPIEELTNWAYIAGSVLATYIVFTLMCVGSYFLTGRNLAESVIKALAASYGNIGYMGPGIALLALGPGAAVPVALIICFENMAHFTAVPMLMAMAGRSGGRPLQMAGEIAGKVLMHPFILASLAGIAAAIVGFVPPEPVERLLETLADAAAPCALFAMGVTLGSRPLRRAPPELVPITLLKLVVHPAICYAVLSLMGDFPQQWIHAAILLAALPSATNVYILAQQYGVWVERASASVLVTTLVSLLTVTFVLYLIGLTEPPPHLHAYR